VTRDEFEQRRPLRLRQVAMNVCEWKARGRVLWATDCGVLWELVDDQAPDAAGVNYCPNCGGRLKVAPP
jgi:hypothetical protein